MLYSFEVCRHRALLLFLQVLQLIWESVTPHTRPNHTSKSIHNIQKPLACAAKRLLKNFQGTVSVDAIPTPCHSLLLAHSLAGLVSMRSSRSSPCGASACPSPCGWTGSGAGGLPSRSSSWKAPSPGRTGSHGSQGTGSPPSCERWGERCSNWFLWPPGALWMTWMEGGEEITYVPPVTWMLATRSWKP